MASLRGEKFQKVHEGSEHGFWGQWLDEARSRYEAFVVKWGGGSDVCAPCDAGEAAAGSGVGASVDAGGNRDFEMGNSCASDSSADALGVDVRQELEAVKLGLGKRGPGLTPEDQAEAEALYQREW